MIKTRGYDIRTGDADNDKYWGFVGQDWVWLEVTLGDMAWVASKSKKSSDREGLLASLAMVYALDLDPSSVTWFKGPKAVVDEIRVVTTGKGEGWRLIAENVTRERRYALALTHLLPKYVALIGWAYGSTVMTNAGHNWETKKDTHWCSWHQLEPIDSLKEPDWAVSV